MITNWVRCTWKHIVYGARLQRFLFAAIICAWLLIFFKIFVFIFLYIGVHVSTGMYWSAVRCCAFIFAESAVEPSLSFCLSRALVRHCAGTRRSKLRCRDRFFAVLPLLCNWIQSNGVPGLSQSCWALGRWHILCVDRPCVATDSDTRVSCGCVCWILIDGEHGGCVRMDACEC